ncbi:hypothetical protein RAD15_23605 [Bradyrhizobium sp. 14AA]
MAIAHVGVVAGRELKRACCMGGGPENMFNLCSFRERVEKRRACRGYSRTCSLAGSRQSSVSGFMNCPLGSPRAVAQRLGPLGAIRERLCRVDREAGTWIAGAFGLEDRQGRSRAGSRVSGDSTKFGSAEFYHLRFICHAGNHIATESVAHHTPAD